MKRRKFIRLGLAGTAAYSFPLGMLGCTKNILEPTREPSLLEFCSPVDLAENKGGFYVEFIKGKSYRPTALTLAEWRLNISESIGGIESFTISPNYEEVMRMVEEVKSINPNAEKTFFNTFQCVGNVAGGNLISNGYFTGIPLRLLLENFGAHLSNQSIRRIYYQCFDGYHTNHQIERILNDNPVPVYFVYKFNGISLDDRRDGCMKHGFPVRLVVQEMLGMKSPKNITQIVISDRDEVDGWWETRPIARSFPDITWADIPPLKINSKIYSPVSFQKVSRGSSVMIQGVAVGGISPVNKIEIGISTFDNEDESKVEWQQAAVGSRPLNMAKPEFDDSDGADFAEALQPLNSGQWPAPYVWCLWNHELQTPMQPGKYRVFVRATDQSGNIQPFSESPQERADGINSIHSVILQVTE